MAYDLTKVHQANLSVLKEIDRICRKYKIRYALDAGTLLGAVRHKGFIPWDDDADVVFTRKNFEKFKIAAEKELKQGLKLLMPDELAEDDVFYDFTPRILYLNSRTYNDSCEMSFYGGKLNHLWVDLFIIDEIPDNPLHRACTLFQMKIIYGLAMGHRYQLNYSKYSLLNRVFVWILAAAGRRISMRRILTWQKAAAVKHDKNKYRSRYYSNYQPDYFYVLLDKDWCERVSDVEFEGIQLMAPENWHQVLSIIYGDYQSLPPEEQRIPSHSNMDDEGFYVE